MSDISLHDAIRRFRNKLPDVIDGHHNGQAGMFAVIAGRSDCTEAPFFTSIYAFCAVDELVYIFAHPGTALILKTYSPDLFVQTVLKYASLNLNDFLDRYDAITLGPGLGRKFDATDAVLAATDRLDVCVISDVDALWHVTKNAECNGKVVDACRNHNAPIVLMPNLVELRV